MTFIKNTLNSNLIEDNIFKVVKQANDAKLKYGDEVIDATIGCLFNEDLSLSIFNSYYKIFNNLSNNEYAKYAQSYSGNISFKQAILKHQFKCNIDTLNPKVIATIGGSGAISCCLFSLLNQNTTLIIPNIGWSCYKLMAQQYNLNIIEYELFDNNNFNIKSFESTCKYVCSIQKNVVVIINDPCHNP